MAGIPRYDRVLSRAGVPALVIALASACVPEAAAQVRQAGSRPDEPPPGVPATPAPPDFAPPQPNRVDDNRATAGRADTAQPTILIGAFVIKYTFDNPGLPAIDDLLKAEVTVGRSEEGYTAGGAGVPEETLTLEDVALQPPMRWTTAAFFKAQEAVLDELHRAGVYSVKVDYDATELENAPGGQGKVIDLRKPGQTAVTLLVRVGRVTEVRTLAFGERIPAERRVNAEEHRRIREGIPIQPYSPDDPERRDVLNKFELDDYVFRLNRHPGRRVDSALGPADTTDPDGVTLDLFINEGRPWMVYFQLSNTGTEATSEWRERFGYINNQLTGDDDTLALDYITSGFSESHALLASYSRPVWEDWLRARVFGSWNQFTASDVGFSSSTFDGDGYQFGAELVANVFQHRETFVDAFAGVRFQHLRVEQRQGVNRTTGDDDFFLPSVGLRLERQTEVAGTTASVSLEWNLEDVAGTDPAQSERLGRLDPDTAWTTLHWDLSHSFFLDPFYFGDAWFDVSGAGRPTLAHQLGLSVRGQYAFDNRLIPTEEQVLGGLFTVRGYPESVVAGDTVIVGTAEYRFHIPQALGYDEAPGTLFGKPFRSRPSQPYGRADWDLILRGFVDAGRVINSDRRGFEEDHTLVGTGVGVELQFRRWLNLRVDWGFALEEVANEVDSGDNRVHFVGTILF